MTTIKGGPPLKFKTPQELEKKAKVYFDTVPFEQWSITGISIHLKTTKDVLWDYQHRDKFADTIRKIKQMIESAWEARLIKRGNSGDIFALKNFGWKDKFEIDNNIKSDELRQIGAALAELAGSKTKQPDSTK
jgi:hypothetical protein